MPLTDAQIVEIRSRRTSGESTYALAKFFGVHPTMIGKLALGKKCGRVKDGPILRSREVVSNQLLLEHDGATRSSADWARRYGLPRDLLSTRIRNGWTVEAALQTPVSPHVPSAIVTPIGPSISYVSLSDGKSYALIDVESIPLVEGRHWAVTWCPKISRYYSHTTKTASGRTICVSMKHVLMGCTTGTVHAKNGNSLDCRLVNLRSATRAQSLWRSRKRKTNTSGFTGVVYRKDKNRWIAKSETNGVRYYFGSSKSKEEAARIYDDGIAKLRGEFARPNSEKEAA